MGGCISWLVIFVWVGELVVLVSGCLVCVVRSSEHVDLTGPISILPTKLNICSPFKNYLFFLYVDFWLDSGWVDAFVVE